MNRIRNGNSKDVNHQKANYNANYFHQDSKYLR